MKIITDIKSGALPPDEIPGFIGFMLRRAAWVFLTIATGGLLVAMLLAK